MGPIALLRFVRPRRTDDKPHADGLVDNGRKVWALDVYNEARPGYHPIAQQRIDQILE